MRTPLWLCGRSKPQSFPKLPHYTGSNARPAGAFSPTQTTKIPMLPLFTNFSRPLRQVAPTTIRSLSSSPTNMGVQKTTISEGNGPSPKQGDRVTMEYVSLQPRISYDSVEECANMNIGTPVGCAQLVSPSRRASSSTLPLAAAPSRHPLV